MAQTCVDDHAFELGKKLICVICEICGLLGCLGAAMEKPVNLSQNKSCHCERTTICPLWPVASARHPAPSLAHCSVTAWRPYPTSVCHLSACLAQYQVAPTVTTLRSSTPGVSRAPHSY